MNNDQAITMLFNKLDALAENIQELTLEIRDNKQKLEEVTMLSDRVKVIENTIQEFVIYKNSTKLVYKIVIAIATLISTIAGAWAWLKGG